MLSGETAHACHILVLCCPRSDRLTAGQSGRRASLRLRFECQRPAKLLTRPHLHTRRWGQPSHEPLQCQEPADGQQAPRQHTGQE